MSITPIFYGKIIEGKLKFEDPTTLSMYLSFLNNKEVQVVIERKKKKRSNAENNYYFGVVIEILSKHFGYEKEDMHQALKLLFLKVHPEGKPPYVKSTTELTTVEMEEYLETIRRWSITEYNVLIPEPNENISWE